MNHTLNHIYLHLFSFIELPFLSLILQLLSYFENLHVADVHPSQSSFLHTSRLQMHPAGFIIYSLPPPEIPSCLTALYSFLWLQPLKAFFSTSRSDASMPVLPGLLGFCSRLSSFAARDSAIGSVCATPCNNAIIHARERRRWECYTAAGPCLTCRILNKDWRITKHDEAFFFLTHIQHKDGVCANALLHHIMTSVTSGWIKESFVSERG